MAASLPSPWPGAITAPTVLKDVQIAQGVPSGNTTAQLNEIAQVQKGLVWYNPNVAPLTRLSTKLKNPRVVENSRFFHLEKQRLPRASAVVALTGGAQTPTDMTVTATHGSRFRVGDLIYNAGSGKGDIALITSFVSADKFNVTSNIGDSSPAATSWEVADPLVNIGNAYEDGSTAGISFAVVEDERSFYCQIFKDAIEYSDRYQKTALYEGDPWGNARKQLEQEHLLGIEYASFLGKPSLAQSGSTDKFTTTMGGVDFYADVNRVDFNGDSTISKAFFDSVMLGAMQEGHSGFENKEMANKTLFGSMRFIAALNAMADDQIRVVEASEKTYGLRLAQYQGSWGVLNIINAPVLNKTGLQDRAYILDLEHVRPANFKGRDTSFEDRIETPGTDGRKAQYLSDKSLIVELKAAHTALSGLAA
ncbi:MAG: SU10 major capsid protein [bacterium]